MIINKNMTQKLFVWYLLKSLDQFLFHCRPNTLGDIGSTCSRTFLSTVLKRTVFVNVMKMNSSKRPQWYDFEYFVFCCFVILPSDEGSDKSVDICWRVCNDKVFASRFTNNSRKIFVNVNVLTNTLP
jgi:hypothetical protein